MTPRAFLIGLFLACVIGSASAEPAAGPAPDYILHPDHTQKSPDGAITIEQYMKSTDDDVFWQFWIRREGTLTLLNNEPASYHAGFRFTNDMQWLVRMQKTGAGYSTLYLLFGGRGVGGPDQEGCELLDSSDVVALRIGREPTHVHVVEHALAQRADGFSLIGGSCL